MSSVSFLSHEYHMTTLFGIHRWAVRSKEIGRCHHRHLWHGRCCLKVSWYWYKLHCTFPYKHVVIVIHVPTLNSFANVLRPMSTMLVCIWCTGPPRALVTMYRAALMRSSWPWCGVTRPQWEWSFSSSQSLAPALSRLMRQCLPLLKMSSAIEPLYQYTLFVSEHIII